MTEFDPYHVTSTSDENGNALIIVGETTIGVIPRGSWPDELFYPIRDMALYWAQVTADAFRPQG